MLNVNFELDVGASLAILAKDIHQMITILSPLHEQLAEGLPRSFGLQFEGLRLFEGLCLLIGCVVYSTCQSDVGFQEVGWDLEAQNEISIRSDLEVLKGFSNRECGCPTIVLDSYYGDFEVFDKVQRGVLIIN